MPSMQSDESVRARFGQLVSRAARAAGYDFNVRGAKADLARATGMSESAVGRMLSGATLPDPRFFAPIAAAVKLDVRDLLVESGIIPAESLRPLSETGPSRVVSDPITPAEAAAQLGITDPVGIEMLTATIERLRRLESDRSADRADDDRGGTAVQM